jgi:hypothetical protein
MNTIRDNDEEEILEEVEEILEEVEEILEEVEEVAEINNNLPVRGDREREYVPNHRRSLRNTGISSDQWLPTTRTRRQSSLFSMTPPTTEPPPRGPPIAVSRIPHPTSARSRRNCCNSCGEDNTLMSKKHMTCYDCLVHFLTTSKIFVQGFDITSKRDSQMCIVCLDTVKHIGSRYVICIDCLITRLGDLNLLKFIESDDIHPLYVAIDTSYETGSADWQRKKYFPCDICSRDKIEDTRTERICMDCLMDKLLDSPYFTKVKRRIYS